MPIVERGDGAASPRRRRLREVRHMRKRLVPVPYVPRLEVRGDRVLAGDRRRVAVVAAGAEERIHVERSAAHRRRRLRGWIDRSERLHPIRADDCGGRVNRHRCTTEGHRGGRDCPRSAQREPDQASETDESAPEPSWRPVSQLQPQQRHGRYPLLNARQSAPIGHVSQSMPETARSGSWNLPLAPPRVASASLWPEAAEPRPFATGIHATFRSPGPRNTGLDTASRFVLATRQGSQAPPPQ